MIVVTVLNLFKAVLFLVFVLGWRKEPRAKSMKKPLPAYRGIFEGQRQKGWRGASGGKWMVTLGVILASITTYVVLLCYGIRQTKGFGYHAPSRSGRNQHQDNVFHGHGRRLWDKKIDGQGWSVGFVE